jgi:hypothetical protein
MDALVAVVIVAAATVAFITTTIITTVAIIAVVVISSPLARLDLHGLALAARGARVERRLDSCGEQRRRGKTRGRPRRWLSCEGTWRCQIRPRALRRFAGHAPAGKIDQRCSITVIHWVGILCLDVRFRGKGENMCSHRAFPVLTHTRHTRLVQFWLNLVSRTGL